MSGSWSSRGINQRRDALLAYLRFRGPQLRGVSKANNEWGHVLMTLLGQHTLKTRTDMRAIRTAGGFLGC